MKIHCYYNYEQKQGLFADFKLEHVQKQPFLKNQPISHYICIRITNLITKSFATLLPTETSPPPVLIRRIN